MSGSSARRTLLQRVWRASRTHELARSAHAQGEARPRTLEIDGDRLASAIQAALDADISPEEIEQQSNDGAEDASQRLTNRAAKAEIRVRETRSARRHAAFRSDAELLEMAEKRVARGPYTGSIIHYTAAKGRVRAARATRRAPSRPAPIARAGSRGGARTRRARGAYKTRRRRPRRPRVRRRRTTRARRPRRRAK